MVIGLEAEVNSRDRQLCPGALLLSRSREGSSTALLSPLYLPALPQSHSSCSINPVTGRVEEKLPNPMEGMTEEQKEYEAMKLVNMFDKLSRY